MRILPIVILLSFMTGCLRSFKVTGYSGGTVIIYCHYSIEEISHEKYFCMGKYSLSCTDQIKTVLKNTWLHSGRFSLYDNTGGNYFNVIIRQLTIQDVGTYWCGVDKPKLPDSYTEVELDVKKDDCCEKSVTETAYLGGEATIRCNYPEDHKDSTKYFCKEDSESDYKYKISGKYKDKLGRYSLSKKRKETFYTVTISDLTEDDTGTYWCGTERTEDRYIALITQVKLHVKMAPPTTTTTITTAPPATTTFTSPSSSSSSSLNGSVAPPTTTTTITTAPPATTTFTSPSSSSSSSLNGSGSSVVIMVSVSLVLLLLVISLLIVYRWKCNKTTGSVSSTHRVSPDTGNNEGGCHGDGDYEEIKERPLQSDSGTATSTIYSTANLPTSHSDSPHYATATITKEGTSSCKYANVNFSQSPTYSTVNHPHSSSEAPPIYSTVSKPRDT